MKESLQSDFVIGNIAKDLMIETFRICGKKQDKKPRFPKVLQRYVDLMCETAIEIHKTVCLVNSSRDLQKRRLFIEDSKGLCIHLSHLIDVSYSGRWISEKQHDRWLGLVNAVYWKLLHWK